MVFLDIETTGLDPETCEIMEIGFALVDSHFEMKDWWSSLVCSDRLAGYLCFGYGDNNCGLNDFIYKMHGVNGSGLIPEIKDLAIRFQGSNPLEPFNVFTAAVAKLDSWGVGKDDEVCGSSVHFDRGFLQKHYPAINEMFHYRNIDVSSDMAYLKKRYPDLWDKIDNDPHKIKEERHRVLPDLIDTLNLMHRIDAYVFQTAAKVWSVYG